MEQAEIDEKLRAIYYDPKEEGSFGGVTSLYNRVKNEPGLNIGRARVKRWLMRQDVYSLFRPAKYNFAKRRIISTKRNYLWEVDLLDMVKYKKQNDGFSFILFAIDTFTRKLHTRALKSKKNDEVMEAFKSIFQIEKPKRIRSDRGMEFRGASTQKLFKEEGIKYYTTSNLSKCAIVERVIKTLKLKAVRMMKAANKFRWVDDLRDLTRSYNRSYHSSIQMSPNEAQSADQDKLFEILYSPKQTESKYTMFPKKKSSGKDKSLLKIYRFKIGQKVRLSKIPQLFDREYDSKWTVEIFTVTDRSYQGEIPMYTVKDEKGETIQGQFYQDELQAVELEEDKLYNIEEILSYRTVKSGRRGTKTQVYVKWEGWPKIYNSWVDESEVKDIPDLRVKNVK